VQSSRIELSVSAGDGLTELRWNALPSAVRYQVIWWTPVTGRKPSTFSAETEAPRFHHGALINGRTYCYRVAALPEASGPRSSVHCATPSPEPLLTALHPTRQQGGVAFTLYLDGDRLAPDVRVRVGHLSLPARALPEHRLQVEVPPLARGLYPVIVEQGGGRSQPLFLAVGNGAPGLSHPARGEVAEGATLELPISVRDSDADPVRVHLLGLPPGATWNESRGLLTFTPTFIQGDERWVVQVLGDDGIDRVRSELEIRVRDHITPPWPEVVAVEAHPRGRIVTLTQTTDAFLDAHSLAGRKFAAKLWLPLGANPSRRLPLRVQLHGFGGAPSVEPSDHELRLYPFDPLNTYWWGYAERGPGVSPEAGTVPDFTARRVLHLVEYVLRHHPADPERVYLSGHSMGGSGSLSIGAWYGRHFAFVESTSGQTVARNHRPSRLAQLSGLWGAPRANLSSGLGLGVWDALDLTWVLEHHPEAREQFLFVRHAKDDTVIHFGAAVLPSPLTTRPFYETLQAERIGHVVVWDEGGHSHGDPSRPAGWWQTGWSLAHDPVTYLRRDLAFPAFTRASTDDWPGDGSGNGRRPWSEEAGFAGAVETPGDTGWSGDPAGARNLGFRWDSRTLVDTEQVFEVALMATEPARADVTPRRVQGFRCLPGERVGWHLGEASGVVEADAEGVPTVPQLPLGPAWQTLRLSRLEVHSR